MRCLIIADIHANLDALNAVLDEIDLRHIDAVWHLGDVVGYGPDPNACATRLRELHAVNIAGNHDWAVVERLDISDFNAEAHAACFWTKNRLTDENWQYLHNLSERLVISDFTLVHGSPQYPTWEYILHSSTALLNFDHFLTRLCLVGHTHAPVMFHYKEDEENPNGICKAFLPPLGEPYRFESGRYIINPGAVGQPRDGDPRAAFALIETGTGANTITFHRVAYPVEVTQRKMGDARLPEQLIARLAYGW